MKNSNGLSGSSATTVSAADGSLTVRPEREFINHPTPEGEALGEMLARFADVEFERNPALRPRCADCAFARGSEPNQIAGTLMNALKCVIEKAPFYCHAGRGIPNGQLCAGWVALIDVKGSPGRAPWQFLEPADDGGASRPRAVPDDATGAPATEGIDHE